MNRSRSAVYLVGFLLGAWLGSVGPAQAMYQGIPYQGKLTDSVGQPVNGPVQMVFRIWYEPENTMAWVETQSVVNVQSGLFNVRLGAVIPIPTNLFHMNHPMTLSIQVGGDGEMHPRIPLYHVPFAYGARRAWYAVDALSADTANYADRAGRVDQELWDAIGTNVSRSSGNVGIGTQTPNERLHVQSAGPVKTRLRTSGGRADMIVDSAGSNLSTVEFQQNSAFRGSIGYDPTRTNIFIYQGSSVVVNNGRVGIGTLTPTNHLEVHGDVKFTGWCRGTYPRPDFDSGWQTYTAGQSRGWMHGLGGVVDMYVVDIQGRKTSGSPKNEGAGGFEYQTVVSGEPVMRYKGYYYDQLTLSDIRVTRRANDDTVDQIRVRIWRYN